MKIAKQKKMGLVYRKMTANALQLFLLFRHLIFPPCLSVLFSLQENLLRLVNIEYSVHGQRDLLQPGRVRL